MNFLNPINKLNFRNFFHLIILFIRKIISPNGKISNKGFLLWISSEKFVEVNTVKFIQSIEQKSLRYFLNLFVSSNFPKSIKYRSKKCKSLLSNFYFFIQTVSVGIVLITNENSVVFDFYFAIG